MPVHEWTFDDSLRPTRRGPSGLAVSRRAAVALLVGITVLCASTGHAAISYVQDATSTTTGTSISATFPSPPTAGNLLVAIAANASSATSPPVPGGWTEAIANPTSPGQIIYYRIAQAGESSTMTVGPYPSSNELGLHIYEWSGVDTASPVDAVGQANGFDSPLSSGTATVTVDDALLVVGMIGLSAEDFANWTNSFTELNDFDDSGSAYAGAYRVVSGAGMYDTEATRSGSTAWRGQIVAFRAAADQTTVFQEGIAGYAGTEDTELDRDLPDTDKGSETIFSVDWDGSVKQQGLVRFESVFGPDSGQIPPGSTISAATLELNVVDDASALTTVAANRMIRPWTEAATWNGLGTGVQLDDIEANAAPDDSWTGSEPVGLGWKDFDVTASLQAWSAGALNKGWVITSSGDNNGLITVASEYSNAALHPRLTVTYDDTGALLDSDGDGLRDVEEDANADLDGDPATDPGPDTDGDTFPSYLDPDDDGDGIPTASENADPNGDGDPRDALDADHDGQPDYLDDPTIASSGSVGAEQKISNLVGGLNAVLENDDRFGTSVASIGDIDGDGVNDIAVGAFWDDDGGADQGAVYILFLNGDGTVKAEQKISAAAGNLTADLDNLDSFGIAVAGIGDLNGDGVQDIAVGAYKDDDGGPDRGAVHILFLKTDGTVRAEQKISNTAGGLAANLEDADFFGVAVAGIGDLDGDGVRDIAVGAQWDDDGGDARGAVYVLFLDANGTVKAEQKISDTTGGFGPILDNDDRFGTAVAGIGDVDGDGTGDLAVTAHHDDDGGPDRGAVYVLFLNTDGTVKARQKISDAAGNLAAALDDGDRFGRGVGALGDVDGDGVNDIVVGAYNDDDGGTDSGAIYVLFLDTDGTVQTEQKISDSQGGLDADLAAGDQFGTGAAGIGDLDDDGRIDIVVGARDDDDGGDQRGAVYILNLAAPANRSIAGTVFEDADFAGTAQNWDGGVGDIGLANVDVELYDAADTYLASTSTAGDGSYTFAALADGAYKVRARSATIGDADTPPAGGLQPTVPGAWPYPLPEMTWGYATAFVGGQDPAIDDTAIGDDAGPGDTWVTVTVGGGDVTGVNLGYCFDLIVNEDDDANADNLRSKQGSLRQFIKNSNAVVGVSRTWFLVAAP